MPIKCIKQAKNRLPNGAPIKTGPRKISESFRDGCQHNEENMEKYV